MNIVYYILSAILSYFFTKNLFYNTTKTKLNLFLGMLAYLVFYASFYAGIKIGLESFIAYLSPVDVPYVYISRLTNSLLGPIFYSVLATFVFVVGELIVIKKLLNSNSVEHKNIVFYVISFILALFAFLYFYVYATISVVNSSANEYKNIDNDPMYNYGNEYTIISFDRNSNRYDISIDKANYLTKLTDMEGKDIYINNELNIVKNNNSVINIKNDQTGLDITVDKNYVCGDGYTLDTFKPTVRFKGELLAVHFSDCYLKSELSKVHYIDYFKFLNPLFVGGSQ